MLKFSGTKMKALTAALLLMLAAGAAGCGGGDKKAAAPAAEKKYNVGIVQLVEHAALDAANLRQAKRSGRPVQPAEHR